MWHLIASGNQTLIYNQTQTFMRVTTKVNNAILVFKLGKTTNAKISNGKEKILQVYSFSDAQFTYVSESVKNGVKINPKTFFDLADSVCFDCPFRAYLKCYTHKYQQYSGFVSMLKSIAREFQNVQEIPSVHLLEKKIVEISNDKYIRFGTYGEPTLLPFDLVSNMVKASKSHTGYTHQWAKKPDYAAFFMASTHSEIQSNHAKNLGFRSFIATDKPLAGAVVCPASKEAGFKSTCEKSGLWSGQRKGTKNIQILEH
jgi:hypothetical protein